MNCQRIRHIKVPQAMPYTRWQQEKTGFRKNCVTWPDLSGVPLNCIFSDFSDSKMHL